MTLPPFHAVIFDFDDTLAASSPLWRQARTELLASIGQAWDPDLATATRGMNAPDIAAAVHRKFCPAASLIDCQDRMRRALIRQFQVTPPAPKPGAAACVRRAAALGPVAVASGSPLQAINLALTHMGIADAFALVVSSESVAAGKPAPDVYLYAAGQLGVAPQDCLAVEDTIIGARAALASGMHCCLIPSSPEAQTAGLDGVQIAATLDELFL
jgi:HAD superfamily hydrolase (TIGR01509 family)